MYCLARWRLFLNDKYPRRFQLRTGIQNIQFGQRMSLPTAYHIFHEYALLRNNYYNNNLYTSTINRTYTYVVYYVKNYFHRCGMSAEVAGTSVAISHGSQRRRPINRIGEGCWR